MKSMAQDDGVDDLPTTEFGWKVEFAKENVRTNLDWIWLILIIILLVIGFAVLLSTGIIPTDTACGGI